MKANDVAAHWESNAETWTIYSRAGYDKYRDALNTPTFLEMLPSVGGLRGLDLGCGEGSNTRAVARLGARVTGLDIAPTFIRLPARARQTRRSASTMCSATVRASISRKRASISSPPSCR
ncbi:2-polyprenyl-3-methyl-5-hydroxy-6-metoxy-1,4-benzoquinol methylase [Rhizobium anhuiense]